jgi:hypothetical protein
MISAVLCTPYPWRLVVLISAANQLSNDSMRGVAEMLEKNTALLALDLGDNNLSDVRAIHLARALELNSTLVR